MKSRKLRTIVTALAFSTSAMVGSAPAAAALLADVAFVIDQSGSMGGEFAWLGSSLSTLDSTLSAGGVTARYAVAGYERLAGNQPGADSRTVYVDFGTGFTNVVNAVNSATVFGGLERGYDAANWAMSGFSWAANASKVIILVTDEAADQGSSISEAGLGAAMSAGGFLLNAIAPIGRIAEWDDAVYSTATYQGFFSLETLRTDPEGFTTAFANAKLQEVIDFCTANPTAPQCQNAIPEPGSLALIGLGLGWLAVLRRRLSAQAVV